MASIKSEIEVALKWEPEERELIERQCKTMEALTLKLEEYLAHERDKKSNFPP